MYIIALRTRFPKLECGASGRNPGKLFANAVSDHDRAFSSRESFSARTKCRLRPDAHL